MARHLKAKPPDHLPKSVLARLLEYHLQVERHGGLSKKAVAYQNAIESDLRAGRKADTPYPASQRLKSGSELVREHEGIHHRVMVMDEGFAWNCKTFTSLSAVAKAITGTNWNGNRFFGLCERGNSAAESST
jgi:hypothetical protein